ncbi:RNA-binding protein [Gammaproteobacteria bacterium 53_120_T64]|nr:RNA-binding protein [Gammaproteobacteria bacterium 53_120_T64]
MTLSNDDKKHLRGIGHKLKPVVTIADKGLTDNVLAELSRALDDHELIKVKLSLSDRDAKKTTIDQACQRLKADCVQSIGHVILLYRRADKPNPKLSNLLRKGC